MDFEASQFPFKIEVFVTTLVTKLRAHLEEEVRQQGSPLFEWAVSSKLDEVLERLQVLESALKAGETRDEGSSERPVLVGVRSFTRRAEDMDEEMDALLRLENHFEGRKIKDPALWHGAVYPELESFLDEHLGSNRRYLLHLSTHTSVAFACGYLLDPKSGVDVVPVQRTTGQQEWRPVLDAGSIQRDEQTEELWSSHQLPLGGEGHDLVVAASVRHNVLADAEAYARKAVPQAGRILHLEVEPKAGPTSVRDGTHGWLLAEDLLGRVMEARTPSERAGSVHLFIAAPAGLVFFAGRLSRGLGRCTLYEFDFEAATLGAYEPSLTFPPQTVGNVSAT